MKVAVFGSGYVGLVHALTLCEVGHEVICVDVDEYKIHLLNDYVSPIHEPGLEELLKKHLHNERIIFTSDANLAISSTTILFIAVGTPPNEDGSADLNYVLEVSETIANNMIESKIIVNKSTVPVGTADKIESHVAAILATRSKSIDFAVVSNPEFLKEGDAIADSMKPDRLIIGSSNDYAIKKMKELYAPFSRNHDKVIIMDRRSAELTKYAANCMLATKISFMNEIASLADNLDCDIENVRIGIGSDPRIGYDFIYPGCGYGGSCFPKDVKALINIAQLNSHDATLLKSVDSVNQSQKGLLFKKIHHFFDGQLEGKRAAIWGLAFKPNTDDMREAPSLQLIDSLLEGNALIQAYDPQSMKEAQKTYGNSENLSLMGTKEAALRNADFLVICTEWKEFRAPDFDFIRNNLTQPVIFDGRNMYSPDLMREYALDYVAIGRKNV